MFISKYIHYSKLYMLIMILLIVFCSYMTWVDKKLGRCMVSHTTKKAVVHRTVCWDYSAGQFLFSNIQKLLWFDVILLFLFICWFLDQFFVEEDVASRKFYILDFFKKKIKMNNNNHFIFQLKIIYLLCFVQLNHV